MRCESRAPILDNYTMLPLTSHKSISASTTPPTIPTPSISLTMCLVCTKCLTYQLQIRVPDKIQDAQLNPNNE